MSSHEFDITAAKDGIVLIDKPAGWTSFDVVAKIRGQIKAAYRSRGETPTKRQLKVGHTGTLDPFATGLLVILLGEATKKADEFLKLDKVYEATIRLGQTSSTGDSEGVMTEVSRVRPPRQAVEAALQHFVGRSTQTPPAYSAIKVNGQRAYALARAGKPVDMPSRTVIIHAIDLINYAYPEVTIRAHVGSGTYIRSLAEDIGAALGTGAFCQQLRRTQIGTWRLPEAN